METTKSNFAVNEMATQIHDELQNRIMTLCKKGINVTFKHYDPYKNEITIEASKASLASTITIKTTQNIFDALYALELRVS